MLNDTSVASAGSYIRTCRRIRNSKKIATIRDFHQNICVNLTTRLWTQCKFIPSFYIRSNADVLIILLRAKPIWISMHKRFHFIFIAKQMFLWYLTAHNWQKWKSVFLTCPCLKIDRGEAVVLKSYKHTWKITIFVKVWNLGQYRENLIFCQ